MYIQRYGDQIHEITYQIGFGHKGEETEEGEIKRFVPELMQLIELRRISSEIPANALMIWSCSITMPLYGLRQAWLWPMFYWIGPALSVGLSNNKQAWASEIIYLFNVSTFILKKKNVTTSQKIKFVKIYNNAYKPLFNNIVYKNNLDHKNLWSQFWLNIAKNKFYIIISYKIFESMHVHHFYQYLYIHWIWCTPLMNISKLCIFYLYITCTNSN